MNWKSKTKIGRPKFCLFLFFLVSGGKRIQMTKQGSGWYSISSLLAFRFARKKNTGYDTATGWMFEHWTNINENSTK